MSVAAGQPLAIAAAFAIALGLHHRGAPDATPRFALALVAGAFATHLGLLGGGGVSVLFLPLGPLLVSRTPLALAVLPLPVAVARLGCLAGGCCGSGTALPLPLLEALALAATHLGCRRRSPGRAGGLALAALGGVRLLEEPWRSADPGLVPPVWLAAGWLALGLGWAFGDEIVKILEHLSDGRRSRCSRGIAAVPSRRHGRTHSRRR